MVCCLFKKTECDITRNGDDYELTQLQWFCGDYNLGGEKFIKVQPLTLSVSQSADKTHGKYGVIEEFGDVILDSTVKIGGEEILEDDYGNRADDDVYSMSEALGGAYFE